VVVVVVVLVEVVVVVLVEVVVVVLVEAVAVGSVAATVAGARGATRAVVDADSGSTSVGCASPFSTSASVEAVQAEIVTAASAARMATLRDLHPSKYDTTS